MDSKSLNKLYIISFLDLFCTAMTLPVLSNYIVVGLKGSHFLLGLLSSLQIIVQIIIKPFQNSITNYIGARSLLLLSHVVTFINYLILITANNYQSFLWFRVPFFIFNQTQYLTEVLIVKAGNKNKEDKVVKRLTIVAFTLGPFCGGLLYHDTSILSVATVLNILTALSFVLAYKLPEDSDLSTKLEYTRPKLLNLWQNNWREYWQCKTVFSSLKILTFIGFTCYFNKFTLIMASNFYASPSLIGFTLALHNIIFLSAQFTCQLIDKTMKQLNNQKLILICIGLMSISMFVLCSTRNYGSYLVACVVLSMAKELFERLWTMDAENNTKYVDSFLKLLTMVLPAVYGAYCDLYNYHAVRSMSVCPLILATICASMFLTQNKAKTHIRAVEDAFKKSINVVNKKLN